MIIYYNIYNYNIKIIRYTTSLKGLLSPISNLLKGVLRGLIGSFMGLCSPFVGSYIIFVTPRKW